MPLPLFPATITIITSLYASFLVKRRGLHFIAASQKHRIEKRLNARCLSIFQNYIQYASFNVALMMLPFLLLYTETSRFDSIELLAAGYIIVVSRMIYAFSAVFISWVKNKKNPSVKYGFTESIKNLLQNIAQQTVTDEIKHSRFKKIIVRAFGLQLFSNAILNNNIDVFKKELFKLFIHIVIAFITYLLIARFLSTPLMSGNVEMPFWKGCLYPFIHSFEICWIILSKNSIDKIIIFLFAIFLFSETVANMVICSKQYGTILAIMFSILLIYFTGVILLRINFHGFHIILYFFVYLLVSKSYLNKKIHSGE